MKLITLALVTLFSLTQSASAGFIPLVPQGARLLGGPGWDSGADVAAAPDGSVYVLGQTRSRKLAGQHVHGEADIVLAKYGPTGGPKWVRLIGGDGDERPAGIAVAGGDVFVAGTSDSAEVGGAANHGKSDVLLARYSTAGAPAWVKLYGSSGEDVAADLATLEGNIYVTGYSFTEARSNDLWVARYDGEGNRQWYRRRGGEREDMGSAIAVTPGGVFVGGQTWSATFLGHKNKGEGDALLLAFSHDGKQNWARYFGTPAIDGFNAITADQYSVYATGEADTPLCCGEPHDFGNMITGRWSVDGARVWLERLGTADRLDSGNGIALSPDGGVIVAGTTNVAPFDPDDSKITVVAYALGGGVTASHQLGGPRQDGAGGIALGPDRAVWVAGWTRGPIGKQETAGKSDMVLYRLRYGKQG